MVANQLLRAGSMIEKVAKFRYKNNALVNNFIKFRFSCYPGPVQYV
jgi:hypothetical protein